MPRRPSLPFVVCALLTIMMSAAVLSCSSGGSTSSLVAPGISTVVITAIGSNDRAQAVVIQSDGKVVAAGSSSDGTKNVFALARYKNLTLDNTDGQLDTTFNTTGRVTTVIGTDDHAQALVIQPDGKLIAAGFAFVDGQYRFAVARYSDVDGSLDATFNPCPGTPTVPCDGIVTTAPPTPSIPPFSSIGLIDDRAFAVAIQSDAGENKIVAAGYSSEDTGAGIRSRLALVRYTKDGIPDATFGSDGNGIVILDASSIPSSPSSTGASALAIQDDAGEKKIVVAGFAYIGTQNVFLLVRYHQNGTPDSSFNGNDISNTSGAVTTAIGTTANEQDEANAVAIDGNNNIVAAGTAYVTGQSSIALARYTTAGVLDTGFNTTGKVTTAILTRAAAFALAIQADKIVVAGSAYNATYPEFVLARYTSTGGLDGTFGSGGKVDTKITYGSEAFGLVMQGDEPIAAGYSQDVFKQKSFTLVRYSAAGVVDTTFPTPP